ncbi:hypothetical protein BH23GEM6_BH23GEM6_19180 [soil metagenome]
MLLLIRLAIATSTRAASTSNFDLTRMLKEDPGTAAILVIAFTVHTHDLHRDRAIAPGCGLSIGKPLRRSVCRRRSSGFRQIMRNPPAMLKQRPTGRYPHCR